LDSYQAGFERLSPSEKAGRVIVTRGETAHQFAIMDDTVAGILFAQGNQQGRYPHLTRSRLPPALPRAASAGRAVTGGSGGDAWGVGTDVPALGDRLRDEGPEGLRDWRIGKPSSRRTAAEEILCRLGLYEERYRGFPVKHFT
jgi:hypothetical protein